MRRSYCLNSKVVQSINMSAGFERRIHVSCQAKSHHLISLPSQPWRYFKEKTFNEIQCQITTVIIQVLDSGSDARRF